MVTFPNASSIKIGGKVVRKLELNGKVIWPVNPTVQELVDCGLADVKSYSYTGTVKGGSVTKFNQIQIHPDCPVSIDKISDLADYAHNLKSIKKDNLVLEGDTYLVWNEELPEGWDPNDVIAFYNGIDLNYLPSGSGDSRTSAWFHGIDFSGCPDFTLSFDARGENVDIDGILHYWGYGYSFKPTPKKLTVVYKQFYSRSLSRAFQRHTQTEEIVLDFRAGGHIRLASALCDQSASLKSLTVLGDVTVQYNNLEAGYMFDYDWQITEVPLFYNSQPRDAANNTWRPWTLDRMVGHCTNLVTIHPTIDFANANTTWEMLLGCNNLEDVRFKGIKQTLDFSGTKLNVESITYILNNVIDVTEQKTLTFSTLHQSEIPAEAIANAQGHNFLVVFV